MTLTDAQKALLKTHILNDATLGPKATAGDYDFVANALNSQASPDFYLWKTSVSARQLMGDAGFDWTRVDNLSAGRARIWEFMMMAGSVDPSQPNIRAGLAAAFNQVADAATLAAILAQCKRLANRAEKVLATGTGSQAVPATAGSEGTITASDIGGIIA